MTHEHTANEEARRFLTEYDLDGKTYSYDIEAKNFAEAERHVAAIRDKLRLLGRFEEEYPMEEEEWLQ